MKSSKRRTSAKSRDDLALVVRRVALIDLGAGKTIDTDNIRDPVVGFVFGSKGLMYNLTFEGSKFTKLRK